LILNQIKDAESDPITMTLQYYASGATTPTTSLPPFIKSTGTSYYYDLYSTSVGDTGIHKFNVKIMDTGGLFNTKDVEVEFLNTPPYFT
jgi:hypothetical protein